MIERINVGGKLINRTRSSATINSILHVPRDAFSELTPQLTAGFAARISTIPTMSHVPNTAGRLGNPDMDLQSDPRALPQLVQWAKQMGLGANTSNVPYAEYDLAKLKPVLQASQDGMTPM